MKRVSGPRISSTARRSVLFAVAGALAGDVVDAPRRAGLRRRSSANSTSLGVVKRLALVGLAVGAVNGSAAALTLYTVYRLAPGETFAYSVMRLWRT